MSLKLPESLKLKPPTKAARKPLSGANQLARRELSEAAMLLRTAVTILCKRLPYCQGVLEKKGKQYTEQAKSRDWASLPIPVDVCPLASNGVTLSGKYVNRK